MALPAVTVALDAMGGDFGLEVVVPAAIDTLERHPRACFILVGDETALRERCAGALDRFSGRLEIHHATQCVEMDEAPSVAMRTKKDSSMRVALNLVKQGRAGACVSAGNTGALMAIARFVLKTLPGIDRPAIISALPSIRGHTYVLDLGANVDLDAGQLFQLAVMGSTLVQAVEGLDSPRVALLNIGEEEMKGNEAIRQASIQLAASDLNYVGFAEGDDIYTSDVDVIVCDGFIGNVALKASEGVAKMIRHFMTESYNRNLLTRFAALVSMPILKRIALRIDPRRYNGATLLGLRGIVVKSHGGADALAFSNAIEIALLEIDHAVPTTIGQEIGRMLHTGGEG